MPNNKVASTGQVISYYARRAGRYPFRLLSVCLLIPAAFLFGQFLPSLIVSRALDRLSKGDFIQNQPWQSFSHDLIIYALLTFCSGLVIWRLVDFIVWRLEAKVLSDIANETFESLINQGTNFHSNHFSGSLVSNANKLLGSYIRIADTTFFSTIPLFSSLVIASVILVHRAPLYVLALDVFALVFIATAFLVSKQVRKRGAVHSQAESRQTGYLADAIGNVLAVKSFAGEKQEIKNYANRVEDTRRKLIDISRAHQTQMLYFGTFTRVIFVTSFALAVVSVVSFKANIATAFLILSYTSSIVDQLFNFTNSSIRNYNRAVGDAGTMLNIIRLPQEITDPTSPETSQMLRGDIRMQDVCFTHRDAKKAIFSNLSLHIKPGEKVGLVGASGSGKTTLTKLLLRFSDIKDGTIMIDGQNICAVTQQDLRRAISYVPQEPILFHRTIAENIAYGRPEATIEEIVAISRQANAHEFIETLPNGYETIVGERGVKLSGGQRQRIAIARAMLKNAPILVLDEATSALDSESEGLIQDALWKLMEGRTAIVIAHRLSTIQKMDRIIVMDKGVIVEEGSHKTLLYKKGIYAKLWDRQSGGFIDE